MIRFLAAAATAFDEAPSNEFVSFVGMEDGSAFIYLGLIALFVVCPFAAGLIHGRQWRRLLLWVTVLGSASIILLTGQVLTEQRSSSVQSDVADAFFIATILTLVPAFVTASVGVLLRRPWTRTSVEDAGTETFQ